ncbi:MAG: hypothetical protein RJB66_303 [Pseudomonadota bacterium]|jgi:hypothetical protein
MIKVYRLILSAILLMFSLNSLGHDEGHGPKITDTGRFGGLLSAVVAKAEASKGKHAALVLKAELVRTGDGLVRLYLYGPNMESLDLKTFNQIAKAVVASKTKGKWVDVPFELTLKEKSFEGQLPKFEGRPFNIDISLKKNDRELLTAFDNLD